MASRGRPPEKFGLLLDFVYELEKWAQKFGHAWDSEGERKRRFVQSGLYHLARVPLVGPDGRLTIPPAKVIRLRPSAARFRIPISDPAIGKLRQLERGEIEEFQARDWFRDSDFTVAHNPWMARLVEEGDSPWLVKAQRSIESQAGAAYLRTWRACRVCARAFPIPRDARNARICNSCRGYLTHLTPREREKILARAPKYPVQARYFNLNEEPQDVYLYIDPNVERIRAPLQRGLDPRSIGFVENALSLQIMGVLDKDALVEHQSDNHPPKVDDVQNYTCARCGQRPAAVWKFYPDNTRAPLCTTCVASGSPSSSTIFEPGRLSDSSTEAGSQSLSSSQTGFDLGGNGIG